MHHFLAILSILNLFLSIISLISCFDFFMLPTIIFGMGLFVFNVYMLMNDDSLKSISNLSLAVNTLSLAIGLWGTFV